MLVDGAMEKVKFSLIMSTLGRTLEVERFLTCLNAQTYRNFELIVIDQNKDDRLISILKTYINAFTIVHLHSKKGVCKGRNVGLEHSDGGLVGFPDDDCWYPPELLQRVSDELAKVPRLDGLSVRVINQDGQALFGSRKAVRKAGLVDAYSIWLQMMTSTLFVRRKITTAVKGFDEQLGPGAPTIYQSGDDTEYVLRMLKAGFKIYYDPEITVYHPDTRNVYSEAAIKKAYFYGCGAGRVLVIHGYPLWYKCNVLIRPLGGALISAAGLKFRKSRFHCNTFSGRLRGLTRTD